MLKQLTSCKVKQYSLEYNMLKVGWYVRASVYFSSFLVEA